MPVGRPEGRQVVQFLIDAQWRETGFALTLET